jgi:hypothetical protein
MRCKTVLGLIPRCKTVLGLFFALQTRSGAVSALETRYRAASCVANPFQSRLCVANPSRGCSCAAKAFRGWPCAAKPSWGFLLRCKPVPGQEIYVQPQVSSKGVCRCLHGRLFLLETVSVCFCNACRFWRLGWHLAPNAGPRPGPRGQRWPRRGVRASREDWGRLRTCAGVSGCCYLGATTASLRQRVTFSKKTWQGLSAQKHIGTVAPRFARGQMRAAARAIFNSCFPWYLL